MPDDTTIAKSAPGAAPRTLGGLIAMLRTEAGLTRDEAAQACGIGAGTFSRYEGNVIERPSLDAVRRLIVSLAPLAGFDPEVLWIAVGAIADRRITPKTADRIGKAADEISTGKRGA